MAPGRLLLLGLPALALGAADLASQLHRVAADKASQYNCSVAIAVRDGKGHVWTAAGGVADFSTGRLARKEDPFVLGSITKTFTGPAALQLVDRGVWRLDDPFAPLVDPLLQSAGRPTLAEKFGRAARKMTLRQVLHMTSGVPDYDTSWNRGDPWRFRQYAAPDHNFGPLQIFDALPSKLDFRPGRRQAYSSSNYVLVGLALAQQAGAEEWQKYDQSSVVPAALKSELSELRFAITGPCSNYTAEHGYDRMGPPVRPSDPGMQGGKDVSAISCLGGWTAGNAVAPVAEVARWTEALFGAEGGVVSKKMQAAMRDTKVPWSPLPGPGGQFYGIAAFNLSKASGLTWPAGEAWGHLGSTYGYQSISAHFPHTGATVVVATNLEIRQQDAPSDALCSAYHSLLSFLAGKGYPSCKYTRSGYFFGVCDCSVSEAEQAILV